MQDSDSYTDHRPESEATNSSEKASPVKLAALSTAAFILAIVAFVGVTFVQVWFQSTRDEIKSADAIVVLGAAQWDGIPSPVLKARLDHALDLYAKELAPYIVTTGSKQKGDRYTEAYTGLTYLLERGIPESKIIVIVDGSNTYQSLSATSTAIQGVGLGNEVLLVSDPYHALRAKEIAREVGLDPLFSPTELDSSFEQLARETIGTSIGRIIGFRRASTLSE
ncbi:MAG: YdcF family protein [Actinomycetota bacterium]|nr:YdcF family protein [Actinomycetota bacterium]